MADADNAALFSLDRTLAFPLNSMVDADTFDQLVTAMTDRAKDHTDPSLPRPNVAPILNQFGVTQHSEDYTLLSETFDNLCDLNAEGRDSIWGFYIRNQVRPLWLSMPDRRVDVLIGNPPWVAYRFMTPDLQKKYRAFANRYNLWHGGEVTTSQDLVALFITRSIAKYLKDDGTFGFVTPLAVLSRKPYEGFREGRWGTQLRCEFTETWDLDRVRPKGFFPVPSAVVFGTKHNVHSGNSFSDETPHGFPTTKQVLSGLRVPNNWSATRKQLTVTTEKNVALEAGSAPRSPYHGVVRQGATITPRVLFFVEEQTQALSKLGTAQGTVAVNASRVGKGHRPWSTLPGWSATLPNRYIFDVHLGSTVVPFHLLSPWRAVLPIDSQELMTEAEIDNADHGLRDWWRNSEQLWEDNKSEQNKLSLRDRINFQRGIETQLKSVKHRVVYTKAGNKLAAARITSPNVVIDHKLYWMPANGEAEAKYLTAILNAPITTELVSVFQSRGLFGGRDFDKTYGGYQSRNLNQQTDSTLT